MNELALFAGAGGGILGGKLLGWRTVCAVEREPYAASVLIARQNDGILPPFPIWDDVCTFDGKPWRGIVDVVSGGFPCQDISAAGKGAGLDGARSGLWGEMARIIGEVRPRYAFIENSPMLTLRGLDRVLCDLASMGFDARWGVVSAADAGAPHLRERIWILANSTQLYSNGSHDNSGGGMERESGSESRDCSGQTIVAHPECNGTRGTTETRQSVVVNKSSGWLEERATRPGCIGDSTINGLQGRIPDGIADQEGRQEPRIRQTVECGSGWEGYRDSTWWQAEPDVGRGFDGLARELDFFGEN